MTATIVIDAPDGFRARAFKAVTLDSRSFTVTDVRNAALDVLTRYPLLTLRSMDRSLPNGTLVHILQIVPDGVGPTLEFRPIVGTNNALRTDGFFGEEAMHMVAIFVPEDDRTPEEILQREMTKLCFDFGTVLSRSVLAP